ncbi:MAG TPA: hypothetical protein VFZ93_08510 [Albitalea sp.]
MLDAFKRWISGGPHGRDWSEVSQWAHQHGHGFKRAREVEGFVVDGTFEERAWRLEWGPPQRAYIDGHELRIRMDLQLPSGLQMLLMTRSLMERLERETFERYTQSNQTLIDVSTPEEMRWLAMFPKAELAELPKELRQRFAAVASDPDVASQWVDAAFAQQLGVVAARVLEHNPPFVLMTLRGRLYLRVQLDEPKPATVGYLLAVFQAAAHAAIAMRTSTPGGDWQSTSSTAWTELNPDEPKK